MAQADADGALSHLNHEIVASLDDFQDPTQEWRRLFSELLGTFFLVLVAAGGGMMGQAFPGMISRAAAVVAPGLMVMAVILFMGKVSGAHLNPAVSIAFSLRGDFPWRRVPGIHHRAVDRRDARCAVPARGDQRVGELRVELSRVRILRVRCVPDGGCTDPRSRQCHSWYRVRRPEHWNLGRDRRRRVHCARWASGGARSRERR